MSRPTFLHRRRLSTIALALLTISAASCGPSNRGRDAGSPPVDSGGDAGALDAGTADPATDAAATPARFVHRDRQWMVDGANAPLLLRCTNVDGWLLPIPYLVSDAGNALFISPSEFADRLDDVVGRAEAEAFWSQWRDRFIAEADFERMAALGFNCARLVLHSRAITRLEGRQTVLDESAMAYVDSAVRWAARHGMYVVLDLHAAPGGQNAVPQVSDVPSSDPVARLWEGPSAAANQAATIDIWRALATRYRDAESVAGYDLLNEPNLPTGARPGELVDLYERLIAAIREVDGGHMLFLEGNAFAHDFSMFDRPLDDNMAYEFHAYALTGFEDWATPEQRDLQPYLDLRAAHGRPIWLGEFGEGTRTWILQMTSLMEANDVGWALYPWKRKQTWFFNPVLQRIPDMNAFYRVGRFLAQPNGSVPRPTSAEADAGLSEALASIPLSSCLQDNGLASALTGR